MLNWTTRILKVKELLVEGEYADGVYPSDTTNDPVVHMIYEWQTNSESGHSYGHYNMLLPCQSSKTRDFTIPEIAPVVQVPLRLVLEGEFQQKNKFKVSQDELILSTHEAAINLSVCVDAHLACIELGGSDSWLSFVSKTVVNTVYIYIYDFVYIYLCIFCIYIHTYIFISIYSLQI